jgi:hypothetical protein
MSAYDPKRTLVGSKPRSAASSDIVIASAAQTPAGSFNGAFANTRTTLVPVAMGCSQLR